MIDYEALMLARQERIGLWEDGCIDGDIDGREEIEELHYNPIIQAMLDRREKR